MLDFTEFQILTTVITNIMVLRRQGQTLNEDEYLYYVSCLANVRAHNETRNLIIKHQQRELKHAAKIDKLCQKVEQVPIEENTNETKC